MHNATHKAQAESLNLTKTIAELVECINFQGEANTVTPKKPNRKRRKYQDGGTRVCIKTKIRYYAEARYRAQAKQQLRQALVDESVEVANIKKCQQWDWRW